MVACGYLVDPRNQGVVMKPFTLVPLLLIALASTPVGCEADEPPEDPVIVGCNGIDYDDHTYFINACSDGAALATVEIQEGEHSACFRIACAQGCIEMVEVCE